jgi:hypothetical protein
MNSVAHRAHPQLPRVKSAAPSSNLSAPFQRVLLEARRLDVEVIRVALAQLSPADAALAGLAPYLGGAEGVRERIGELAGALGALEPDAVNDLDA